MDARETAGLDIAERTFRFGLRVLGLVKAMQSSHAASIIARQVLRSGTSVGANVEEAQGAHSRADFAYCLNVAKKEARETRYWLKMMIGANLVEARAAAPILQEAEELVRILSKSVITASANQEKASSTP